MTRRSEPDEVRDGVALTSLDTELFDGAGATKRELIDHLDAVGDQLVAALSGRPLTVLRARSGQPPFMQKNLPKHAPPWIPTVEIWSQAGQRTVRYPLCEERRTLLWFGNQRSIEFHPTLIRWPDEVTALLIDLDPPEHGDFRAVRRAAVAVRAVLEEWRLPAAVKTSGAKGVHIAVPVTGVDIADAAAATAELAARAAALAPDVATVEFIRADRGGRVFVDSTRAGGASVAAAYSPRARPGLPVSFPLGWDDLDSAEPGDFTVRTAAGLLGRADPWAAALAHPVPVPPELIERGRAIASPRVAAMHEGRRRRRAARAADPEA